MRRLVRPIAKDLWCIVLAAGGSRRLGRPKQLLTYRRQALLTRALDIADSVVAEQVIVVLGAEAIRIRGLLRRRGAAPEIAINSRWQEGLAGSLRAGLRTVPWRARGVLILLTDQPRVSKAGLSQLVSSWRARPAQAAAARYAGRIGVPAILPRRLWGRIDELTGDQGARALIRGIDELRIVDMPEAEFDIDTPEDLARIVP